MPTGQQQANRALPSGFFSEFWKVVQNVSNCTKWHRIAKVSACRQGNISRAWAAPVATTMQSSTRVSHAASCVVRHQACHLCDEVRWRSTSGNSWVLSLSGYSTGPHMAANQKHWPCNTLGRPFRFVTNRGVLRQTPPRQAP